MFRGSIGDNDEYDPSNVVDEIDIDPPGIEFSHLWGGGGKIADE